MGQKWLQHTLKRWGSFCLILILLPYIITTFVHGADTVSGEEIKADEKTWLISELARDADGETEPEFLKALAVVFRTNLYREQEINGKDMSEEFTEGVYFLKELEEKLGTDSYYAYYGAVAEAVENTEDQILYYDGQYAWLPCHESSNGKTRNAGEILGEDTYPYLVSKECPADKEAEDEIQAETFEYREIQKKCKAFLVAVEEKDAEKVYTFSDFEIVSWDSAGYVKEMRIGETTCTGDQFREALNLASGSFTLKDKDGRMCITSTGKGHGLGMSRWTARQMAQEGRDYQAILQYFYEGTQLQEAGRAADENQGEENAQ